MNQSRRQFIQTSTLAATAAFAAPYIVRGAVDGPTLRIGLVGCGGRGTGAASEALLADPNCELVVMGDAFAPSLQRSLNELQRNKAFASRVKVTPENSFVGLDAYRKVLASNIDVVLLASPPGFRPTHFKAAVAAGKHIFCEKPMATDAPGLRTVMEAVEVAKQKKISLVAGFCWRYQAARRELYKRIHAGQIGDLRAIYATYYTSPVKPMPRDPKPTGMSDLEWQVRNWYNFSWLSGDHIVEQAVHSVDKLAWAMKDVPPIKAVATGGRQARSGEGNIFDHFHVAYEYADGTRAFLGCRQQNNCYGETADSIMGTKGVGRIKSGRRFQVDITGENAWHSTPEEDEVEMYQQEHNEFFASIRSGKPIQDGDRMCSTTMMALMGRMAAYTGIEITWEQALNAKEKLVPDFEDWDHAWQVPPVAIPGVTRLV